MNNVVRFRPISSVFLFVAVFPLEHAQGLSRWMFFVLKISPGACFARVAVDVAL